MTYQKMAAKETSASMTKVILLGGGEQQAKVSTDCSGLVDLFPSVSCIEL